jgi:hypothetical protein
MNESTLKAALVKELRATPRSKTFRHEDQFTHGVPDISFTWRERTMWIEGKFANPNFKSKGIQELNMKELALAGLAFYVVWEIHNDTGDKSTYIVEPRYIGTYQVDYFKKIPGFNAMRLATEIRLIHDNIRT